MRNVCDKLGSQMLFHDGILNGLFYTFTYIIDAFGKISVLSPQVLNIDLIIGLAASYPGNTVKKLFFLGGDQKHGNTD